MKTACQTLNWSGNIFSVWGITEMKKVFIYKNDVLRTLEIAETLVNKLSASGIYITDDTDEADIILCVGGDGTLLNLMQNHEFPTVPVAGINTGHLGFFQEIAPDKIDVFIKTFLSGELNVQPYNIAKADIIFKDGSEIAFRALNEFVIKGHGTHPVHLNISINESFIERFSGDGIIVSTPAGSTAYNYSLGGALVDPRLNLLQVAPMAPMNNTAYRSLTSSILLPANDSLIIEPCDEQSADLAILFDGQDKYFSDINSIELCLSRRKINLVRFGGTTFWDKVKTKFL